MNGVMHFDGRTFNQEIDGKRLTDQFGKVFELMKDGIWRSLREIAEATGFPESSISARLRDFRKPKFGGHTVNRERRYRDRIFTTWEYQLLIS